MPIANPEQLSFAGGLNAQVAPDKIADSEVVTATNIDFSKETGAASIRRGSIIYDTIVYGGVTSTVAINTLFRTYNNPTDLSASPFYGVTAEGVYRSTASGTWTRINTYAGADSGAIGVYGDYTLIGLEVTDMIKDDGTVTTDWVKQSPSTAPVLSTIITATNSFLTTGSVIEGTGTYSSGTWTASSTDTGYRIVLEANLGSGTNLSTIGGINIGDYGVDYLKVAFTDPSAVFRISRDYSIGGTSFENYFHAEAYPAVDIGSDLLPGVDVYLQGQPIEGVDTLAPLGRNQRSEALVGGRGEYTRPATEGVLGRSPALLYNWAIARPNFQMIGQYTSGSGASPWSNIGAVRIIVECTSTCEVRAANWYLQGDEQHSLSDPQIGYNYWVSFATLDADNNLIDESASSPVLQNVRVSQGQPVILHTGTATSSHGITHRIWYRQGGLLGQPYAVSTQTALSAGVIIETATLTDTLPDIKAITAGWVLQDSIYSKADFPGIPTAICEYQGRVFVGFENYIIWTVPGKVGTFLQRNVTAVSGVGDEVQALHVIGNTLVIVNRDSIYTLRGSIFEGSDQNWVLSRSGSRHGSKASKVAKVLTPFGIPILDYDGLFMFDPGAGVEQEIPWINQKIGDLFRGNGAADPAILKGTRVPPLNKSYIRDAMAVYTDGKLYLGLPCESASKPSIMFVIEFATQRVWLYNYGINFITGFWDFIDNKLLITSESSGRILQIEHGQFDESLLGGIFNQITYSIKPKMLTGSNDFRLENMSMDIRGGTSTVKAIVDNTSTITVGTFTNTVRDWQIPPLNGSVINNLQFAINGYTDIDQEMNLWGIGITAISEPEQVRFWRTEYQTTNNTEQRFDVYFADYDIVGVGTVTTVVYVDGTAVATGSHAGPTSGRRVFPVTIPVDSFGYVAWAISTSTSDSLRIKPFNGWFSTRPEPPRINSYKSDIESLDEHIIDAFDVDMNPNGTATAVVYIDNTAVSTFTFTGTNQQSYTRNLIEYPNEIYGRTMYVTYTGSGFKHFKTWWHRRPEPDRWTSYDTTTFTYPSENYIKTWIATINAMGTCTATLYLDNVATQTATLTGTHKQVYNIGIDTDATLGALSTATTAVVVYRASAGNYMKHYDTKLETEPKPFGKLTWSIAYSRIGGSRRLDHAQHWSADIEVCAGGTATITSHWYCDQRLYSTATLTMSGREWREWIPMPPDGRGYLFEQRIYSATPIRVWRSTLDVLTEGAKGVSRATYVGTPNN